MTYAVFKGNKNIGHDDLGFPVSGEIIRIVPVIIGGKKAGILQTILGAVIVAASVAYGFFFSQRIGLMPRMVFKLAAP